MRRSLYILCEHVSALTLSLKGLSNNITEQVFLSANVFHLFSVGWDTDYAERIFVVFSVPIPKFRDIFLPVHFQFIIQQDFSFLAYGVFTRSQSNTVLQPR
jgi:hypothetical protein